MVIHHHVEGYKNFLEFMKNLKPNESVYVLYTGTKLSNGNSWCPDCVEAKPFIEEAFKVAPESTHFIEVEVGDRAYWKDLNCPFRSDPTTKLKVLPTLAKWDTQKRLEGDHCSNRDLLEMLIFDEDN